MMKFVLHFHPRLLDAYRLRQKRRIPILCVTYFHLSDDKLLFQNVGLGSSTQRRSVGTRGTRPSTFQPEGASIGNVLTLFQFIKQIYRLITPLS